MSGRTWIFEVLPGATGPELDAIGARPGDRLAYRPLDTETPLTLIRHIPPYQARFRLDPMAVRLIHGANGTHKAPSGPMRPQDRLVFRSLLEQTFKGSIVAPCAVPECGIEQGDVLRFEPETPDLIFHGRPLPRDYFEAVIGPGLRVLK